MMSSVDVIGCCRVSFVSFCTRPTTTAMKNVRLFGLAFFMALGVGFRASDSFAIAKFGQFGVVQRKKMSCPFFKQA